MSDMDKLFGFKVEEAHINAAKDLILLRGRKGYEKAALYLSAFGDCCSRSWFEHVEGLDALIGQEVRGILDRKMPEDTESDGDVTRYYGWSILTEKGRCELEMRNESNGYYGGYVNVDEKPLDQYHSERGGDDLGVSPLLADF